MVLLFDRVRSPRNFVKDRLGGAGGVEVVLDSVEMVIGFFDFFFELLVTGLSEPPYKGR